MLQRRSQHFSKRNRHVYAAERMQHTSVYNSSGRSRSRVVGQLSVAMAHAMCAR